MLTLDATLIMFATVISAAGYLPYISDIIKGKNKPSRVTWCIWSILGIVLCLTSFELSDYDWMTICVPLVYAIGPIIIAILSFWYGEGGSSKLDIICFILAFVGLGLWLILDFVILALWLSILIDIVGALPTIKKSYTSPKSESMLGWATFTLANAINLGVLFHRFDGSESIHSLVYPLYLFLISSIIIIVMLRSNIKSLFSNNGYIFNKKST